MEMNMLLYFNALAILLTIIQPKGGSK